MTETEIHKLCIQYKIENYTINPDMSIDVDGDVSLRVNQVDMPLVFNKVTEHFDCSGGGMLTSLKGCPKEVGGYFYCHFNDLKTLEHFPDKVGMYCYVGGNRFVVDDQYFSTLYHIYQSDNYPLYDTIDKLLDIFDDPKSFNLWLSIKLRTETIANIINS